MHFLLLMLLGQFISAAWSCSMASVSVSLHDEHRVHMGISENTAPFHDSVLSDEPASSDIAPCCGDDDGTCPPHHCNALSLTYLFETQEAPLADSLHSLSYKSSIKRTPSALYRPPITFLSLV